jgi:CDP-glucose 4,6-dehydratase
VIGGGDFANDRIIPDSIRAAAEGQDIIVRNSHSTRPYQHVLEPLAVYMTIAMKQYEDSKFQGYYNVGPDDCDCVTTGELVDLFCKAWGQGIKWADKFEEGPHEASFLKLDCSKIKKVFGWSPKYGVKEAVEKTVEWTKTYLEGADMLAFMDLQIKEFFD